MLPATQNDVLDALKRARDREEFPLVYQVLDKLAVGRAGVRPGYSEGYLCNFLVSQPFSAGVNTRENIPAVFLL